MRRLGAALLTICLVAASGTLLAQEENAESEIKALREQNEELKKEMEALRKQLEEVAGQKGDVSTGVATSIPGASEGLSTKGEKSVTMTMPLTGSVATDKTTRASYITMTTTPGGTTKVVTVGPQSDSLSAVNTLSRVLKGGVELKKWEIESATLSHGDAGLETMLRFEKAKIYRTEKKLDKAIEELQKIIGQNVSDVTTHAARLTLIEILLEQKKKDQAIVEFEKILETAKDASSRRDAIYGIINLVGGDPDTKIETIDRLLEKLKENPIKEAQEAETTNF